MLPTEKVLLVARETPSQWGIFLSVHIHLLLGDWLQRSLLERSRRHGRWRRNNALAVHEVMMLPSAGTGHGPALVSGRAAETATLGA